MIGRDDAEPGHALHRIAGAFVASNGSNVVGLRGSNEIRVFDRTGNLDAVLGGAGSGPAEFMGLASVHAAGDSLSAYDGPRQRVSYWSGAGGFGGGFRIEVDAVPLLAGRMGNGNLIVIKPPRRSQPPVGSVSLDSAEIIVAGPDGRPVASLGRFPWTVTHAAAMPALGGRTLYSTLSLSPQGAVAVGGDHVYVGYGDRWQIAKLSPGGRVVRIIERAGAGQPITRDVRAAWQQEWLDRPQVEDRDDPALLSYLRDYPLPDRMPAFDSLLVDDTEHLWVHHARTPGSDTSRWSIFSPAGDHVAEVAFDDAFSPLHVGRDFILGRFRDEDLVEQIQLRPLRR